MKIKAVIFKYSNYIVTYTFFLYLFFYIIFSLYKKNIVFDYILILLLGIYIGFKLGMIVLDYYISKNESGKY